MQSPVPHAGTNCRLDRALRLLRFGIVGGCATAVHAGVYAAMIAAQLLAPLTANGAAFVCAFAISWLGHRHWTFGGHQQVAALSSVLRFLIVALSGLGSNLAFTALFVYGFDWPPQTGLVAIVCITPVLVFLGSKYWAFTVTAPVRSRSGRDD